MGFYTLEEKKRKRLNEPATWNEVIKMIAETRAQIDSIEARVDVIASQDYSPKDIDERNVILQDLSNKTGTAIENRKAAIEAALKDYVCRDIED